MCNSSTNSAFDFPSEVALFRPGEWPSLRSGDECGLRSLPLSSERPDDSLRDTPTRGVSLDRGLPVPGWGRSASAQRAIVEGYRPTACAGFGGGPGGGYGGEDRPRFQPRGDRGARIHNAGTAAPISRCGPDAGDGRLCGAAWRHRSEGACGEPTEPRDGDPCGRCEETIEQREVKGESAKARQACLRMNLQPVGPLNRTIRRQILAESVDKYMRA